MAFATSTRPGHPSWLDGTTRAVPPHVWFGVSALFHYLGPSFAVLLFPSVGVLGVAWLRIASAAAVFAPFTAPWRVLPQLGPPDRWRLIALGACLAVMNCSFYLALARLPLGLVAAIEFVGTIAVALYGLRSRRNVAALVLVVTGVVVLVDVRWAADPIGLGWAVVNGILFVVYLVLGHSIASRGAATGVARLGAAMAVAFVVVSPIGFGEATRALSTPRLLFAGVGVGVCSSVVPYVCDQIAMSRLPRATFALLLALLPACATLIGALVLAQVPRTPDLAGLALVMAGVALHRPGRA